MPIIYFHGFQGSRSQKPEILARALRQPVYCPRYNDHATFKAAIESAVAQAQHVDLANVLLIVGMSLGGFAAYCTARMTNAYGVLVNPALQPWDSLAGKAPRAWLDYCRWLYDSLPADDEARLHAIVNVDDERLAPFQPALEEAGVCEVTELQAGGHQAVNFETEIVPLIVTEYQRLLRRAEQQLKGDAKRREI